MLAVNLTASHSSLSSQHYPVVHFAKYSRGLRVVLASKVLVFHADLPKHGTAWHSEPMKGIWEQWLQPYLGKSLADPALKTTRPPEWWGPRGDDDRDS
eukprot:SAG22_NODE_2060_length_3063_cov_1.479757_3_plen_98_part_00